MKNTVIASMLALTLSLGLFPSLSIGDEQSKERDDVALEIMTVEVMVDQLEKMRRVTEDEQNAWARLFMDIEDDWFCKIITYETRDNLNLWKLVGRWATAEGVSSKSANANAPFFHIQRLQPDYQKDKEIIRLMAKLNAIRNKEHQDLEIDGYRNFVYLFEECDTGDARIQFKIGWAYKEGYGLWKNYTETFKWYKKVAEQGDADAQGLIGLLYYQGEGVAQDYKEAFKWSKKAAEQGNATAQGILGLRYYEGKGVTQDYNEAFKWYKKAAEQGNAFAQGKLGFLYYVSKGVTQDYTEAFKWYKKAAEQGNAFAQSKLGIMYYEGKGVTQDYTEAIKWCKKAAEQGDAGAQAVLGVLYSGGEAIVQDYVEAYKWLVLAIANGADGAVKVRDAISKAMTPSQIEKAQTLAKKAWEQHNKENE